MRSNLVTCPRKFYWGDIRHLRKSDMNIDQHFGWCFARGLEVTRRSRWEKGRPAAEAVCDGISAGIEAWGGSTGDALVPETGNSKKKTSEALIDALASYFEHWPLDSDDVIPHTVNGELFVERTLAWPIEGTRHPTTGNPIVYSGRLDMLGYWKTMGTLLPTDEKTTTALGEKWRAQWKMRGQLIGYPWLFQKYGFDVSDALVRGIGIYVDRIEFDEVLLMQPPWKIEMWHRQLVRDVNRAIGLWKAMAAATSRPWEEWDQCLDNSGCFAYYHQCPYTPLCHTPNPERWIGDYQTVVYDPLKQRTDDEE